jgi:2-polyprenyl-3-methyl-5-hydroxy-6-metoxy-1,4-benzoquinol methylase
MTVSVRSLVPASLRSIVKHGLARLPARVPRHWLIIAKWVDMNGVKDELLRCDAARKESETAFHDALRSFWVRLPRPPADAWSHDYREHWFSVYESLSGSRYDLSREASSYDVEKAARKPFPYFTESYQIVGEQFLRIGSLIRAMALPAGASVLDLGAGWGNSSLALAQMGCRVTTLDIESRHVELLKARAAQLQVPLTALRGDFFAIDSFTEPFDAVLFYEAFHHCHDHLRLLDALPRIISPRGKLVLACETVNELLPYEWGLNPNGEAIWQIVNNGWFELAFRESYLLRTLSHKGWKAQRFNVHGDAGTIYVAQRR